MLIPNAAFTLLVNTHFYMFLLATIYCSSLLQFTFSFCLSFPGHGKFETLGALGISVMLLGTAGGIAWHALDILVVGSILFLPIMKQYDDPIVIYDSLIPFFYCYCNVSGIVYSC